MIVSPRKRRGTIVLITVLILVFAGIGGYFGAKILLPRSDKVATKANKPVGIKLSKPLPPPKPTFNKAEFSNVEPSSLWIIVNKQHHLNPVSYTPTSLITTNGATIDQRAQTDFELLMTDAKTQSINLNIVSSYRSYSSQTAIYNNYVSIYGQAKTDTFSARPGYSEHQTGLSIDLGSYQKTACDLDDCFGQTPEGVWLATNASKYGFVLRYPADKQPITGYKSEPWHYRYVGKKLVDEMQKQGVTTLEEFFGISGGETYI